jgi:hypothetical protein
MQKYIGTKIIEAEQAVRGDCVKDTSAFSAFQLAEEGYRVRYPDGYESWSPKDVFEAAYRKTNGMSLGLAIEAAEMGKKVARDGWNGKGLFVVYQKGYPQGIPCNKQTAAAWGMNEGDLFMCNPYLQIRQADGSHSMWAPSVGDALAKDWFIVD